MSADAGVTIVVDAGAESSADSSPWSLVPLPGDPALLDWVELTDMGAAGADLYVVGGAGMILRSTDQGDSWSAVGLTPGGPNGRHPILLSFAATAEDDVWIAGIPTPADGRLIDSLLLHGTDRGQTWQTVQLGDGRPVYGVWAIDRQRVVVANDVGEIRRTDDAGGSWTRVFADAEMILRDFWGPGTGATDLYAVGSAYVRATPDGGQPPDGGTGTTTTTTNTFTGVILRSADAGATWSVVMRDAPCQLWQVAGTPDGAAVYAAGNCGTIAWTTDHGASWETSGAAWRATDAQRAFPIRGVWVSPAGRTRFALDREVCAAIDVRDYVSSQGGCEPLPWRDLGNGVRTIASPAGLWGGGGFLWSYGTAGFLWRRPWP